MSYSMETRNMQTMPSVRRRHFGPYKPCPRAQRVALMEKQDTENTPESENSTENLIDNSIDYRTEENIDFAVESSKVDTSSPPVIELDDENEDSVDSMEVDDEVNLVSVEENSIEVASLQVDDNVEDHINETSINQQSSSTGCCTPTRPSELNLQASQTNIANNIASEFSPQVVLERTPEHRCTISRSITTNKQFETYTLYGYVLRNFNIMLNDCCPTSVKEPQETKSYSFRRKNSSLPKEIIKTPSKNMIKNITCDASQPEFIENYENVVARKLESLRKRLDATSPQKQSYNKKSIAEVSQTTILSLPVTSSEEKSITSNVSQAPCSSKSIRTDEQKKPVHPRTRLRLSPLKPTKPSVGSLTYAISTLQNYVELSDSDTESQYSIMSISESGADNESETLIKNEDNESIQSDDCSVTSGDEVEVFDTSEETIKQEVKTEIKTENPEYESKSYYIESDDEMLTNILDAYETVERRRRKTSSRKRIQSFMMPSPSPEKKKSKPSLIQLSPKKSPSRTFPSSCTYPSSSSSVDTYSHYNRVERISSKADVHIDVVKLSTETVRNLIRLCTSSPHQWNDNTSLEKAGMSWYDINRLGIVTSSRQKANYGLRQFVKKHKKWIQTSSVEKPKASSSRKGQKKVDKKALKALRHRLKQKELEEQKKKEQESIRRSLLRINARLMNQNKFWAFINQGCSEDRPIVI